MLHEYFLHSFVLGILAFGIVSFKTNDRKLATASSLILGLICIAFVFDPIKEADMVFYFSSVLTIFYAKVLCTISWVIGTWLTDLVLNDARKTSQ